MTGIEKLPNRIVWADVARVLALLLMVQGHTIDVLLSSALREGHLHDLWLYCRGLTAPTFMFLSGFSFAIASLKRWDSYLIPSPALRKRVTRFLFLIALGYAMHLPVRSVHDFGHVDQGAWHAWLQIDVLQCIGVALLILQTLVFIARDQKRFAIVAACLSGLIVLATPFLWSIKWTHYVPEAVGAYFTGTMGSLFPPFPWAAYVLAGASVGYVYSRLKSTAVALPTALIGLGMMSLGTFFNKVPFTVFNGIEYWRTSPNLFLIRVGCVFVLISIVAFITERVKIPAQPTQFIAQETLIVYFIHVCILYGSIWNPGLQLYLGKSLGWSGALLVAFLLQVSMVALAYWWHKAKRTIPQHSAFARTAIVGLAVAYWLF